CSVATPATSPLEDEPATFSETLLCSGSCVAAAPQDAHAGPQIRGKEDKGTAPLKRHMQVSHREHDYTVLPDGMVRKDLHSVCGRPVSPPAPVAAPSVLT